MKPRITKLRGDEKYFELMCKGVRPDGVEAWGFGHTIEEAYQRWLEYDETDIPF